MELAKLVCNVLFYLYFYWVTSFLQLILVLLFRLVVNNLNLIPLILNPLNYKINYNNEYLEIYKKLNKQYIFLKLKVLGKILTLMKPQESNQKSHNTEKQNIPMKEPIISSEIKRTKHISDHPTVDLNWFQSLDNLNN